MSANQLIRLIEVPVSGREGLIWNRLHSEREDICEAMLKRPGEADKETANWRRELLQTRMRNIDDALDRLMSGSFGNCRKCGKGIADSELDFDPSMAFCTECGQLHQNERETRSLTNKLHEADKPSQCPIH